MYKSFEQNLAFLMVVNLNISESNLSSKRGNKVEFRI